MDCYKSGILAAIFILTLSIAGCVNDVPVPSIPIPSLPTAEQTQTPAPLLTAPPTTASQATTGQSLSGTIWYLIAFNKDGSSSTILPGTVITAIFDTTGQVSGSSGCNRYTAPYGGTLNSLWIGAPVITKMNCPSAPPGTASQESLYLTTIRGTASYRIDGSLLTLLDHNGKQILTYSNVPPGPGTPLPLEGTTWYLNSFIDAQGHIFKPGTSAPVSIHFGGEGILNGFTGCNNYTGRYAIGTGGMITISDIASPRLPCTDPTLTEQENLYLGSLPSMKLEVVTGSELALSDGTGKATMLYDTTP